MSKKKLIEMLDGAIDLNKITAGMAPLESCTEIVEWGSDRTCYSEPGDTKYAGYKIIPREV